MPFEKILFFFVPADANSDEIYNPTDLKTYRSTVGGKIAKLLGVQKHEIVLTEKVNANEYRIIRRINWPASQDDFDKLMYEGSGTGDGGSQQTFILEGDDDKFNLGTPLGFHGGKTFLLAALLLIAFMIIKDR